MRFSWVFALLAVSACRTLPTADIFDYSDATPGTDADAGVDATADADTADAGDAANDVATAPDVDAAVDGMDAPETFDAPDSADTTDAQDVGDTQADAVAPDTADAPDAAGPDATEGTDTADAGTDVVSDPCSGKNCDDGIACTADSCTAQDGCTHTADNSKCDDGKPCTSDSCGTVGGCIHTNTSGSCDDGSACTEGDACASGSCTGTPKACGDTNPCTVDSCDTKTGCVHAPAGSIACDDGNFCTVNDLCSGTTCGGSAGAPCSDNNICTTDVCSGTAGNTALLACSYTDISGTKCDDANACTADSCDPTNGCIHNKLSDTACNDGNAGTIGDTCVAGTCVGSIPECLDVTQCNDNKTCTVDSCDSVNHTCKHATASGTCLIDSVCYSDGQLQVGNACLACISGASNSAWSVTNESLSCGTAGTCASGVCKDPWPPTAPLANGKVCTLPACDAASTPAFYTGGNWTVTTKTISTTCNSLIQLVEPRANVGYTKTGKAHPMNFVGGCDYAPGGMTTQIGTIVSNVEASCDISVDANYGVTSVETSIITYGAGKGTGTATATLYDLPAGAGQPNNSCEIVVQVTVQHVPDCTADGDCSDGITCTTDTCSSGLCLHTLAAQTCLIGGQCIADGAYESSTGNGSCRLCAGKFPSQYGWIILSYGEPCNDGNASTTGETCTLAGVCLAPPN